MASMEKLATAGATLGEGGLWRAESSTVLWVDILNGQIHETSLDGVDRVIFESPEPVSSVQLDTSGQLVYTGRYGLITLEGTEIATVADGPVRLNDSAVAPDGTLIVGTMGYPDVSASIGDLFRVGPQGVATVISDVTISNGIGWTSDGLTMFYIDTPTQRVDAFDRDPATGQLTSRRPWAEIDPSLGNPDGLCVDSEDGVWVALWGGGRVVRLVNGKISHVIDVPTQFVTCPAFAGDRLDQLVVTTASEPFEGSAPAGAGDLYVVDASVVGQPSHRLGPWAGDNTG